MLGYRLRRLAFRHPAIPAYEQRFLASATPPWRPAVILDEWVQKEARPISLRQLTFFGRTLTENRLISSANYVRNELPTRLAHRLRDMQTLPFVVVTNPHISHVYELYYKAFETLRRIEEIKTVEENDRYCGIVSKTLQEHLTVIPRLAMGVIECQDMMPAEQLDRFMNILLRSRISRRVIAEQHLSLTETFNSPWHFPDAKHQQDPNLDSVGEVFLRCNAKEVVTECGEKAKSLAKAAYGPTCNLPEIVLEGHLDTTFPYILTHLQYIVGELLRNSIQAVVEKHSGSTNALPPIEVLICEAPQHVIIRISDRGGGIPKDVLPDLWSFGKSPRNQTHLSNLLKVPKMAATMQELQPTFEFFGLSDFAATQFAPWSSRRVLSNISNQGGQIPSPQQDERVRTPTALTTPGQGKGSNTKIGFEYGASIRRRRFSKQHGDLSQLRPVSPPLQIPSQHQDNPFLSPGKYIEDVPTRFSAEESAARNTPIIPVGYHGEHHDNHIADRPEPSTPAPISVYKRNFESRPLPPAPTQEHEAGTHVGKRSYNLNRGKISSMGNHDDIRSLQTSPMNSPRPRSHHFQSIQIQNLGPKNWYHPVDVFMPVYHAYPPLSRQRLSDVQGLGHIHEALPLDHISISTTWKGLSWTDAEQLLQIHRTFQNTVSYLLAGQIADLPQSLNSTSWTSALTDSHTSGIIYRKLCCLDWSQLVGIIKNCLECLEEDHETSTKFNDILYLYLSVADCFQFGCFTESRIGSVDFILKHHKINNAPLLNPVVEATWLPDYLSFSAVSLYPREGEELVIVPLYRYHAHCGPTRSQHTIAYRLVTQLPWLEWDDTVSGWKGTIPRYSEIRDVGDTRYGTVFRTAERVGGDAIVNLLRIEAIASRKIATDSGARVERTVRARLTIKVKPYWVRDRTVSSVSQAESTKPSKGDNSQRPLSGGDSINLHKYPRSSDSAKYPVGVVQGRITPSMTHWSARSHKFEKEVMSKVRNDESPLAAECLNQEFKLSHPSRVETITDILEKYSLSKTPKTQIVYDTDVRAYPVTIPRAMEHHNSHMFANPYTSARRVRRSAQFSASNRNTRTPSAISTTDQHNSIIANVQASMSTTRRKLGLTTGEGLASSLTEQIPGTSLEALQRLPQRQITPQSVTATASECSFGGGAAAVQLASAEVFAIAQNLHNQPNQPAARKRARGASFEHSTAKRTREHSGKSADASVDRGFASSIISTGTSQSAQSDSWSEGDDLSTTLTSPVTFKNRYTVPASRRNDGNSDSIEVTTESNSTCRIPGSHDPYKDPQIQEAVRQAAAAECLSTQERKDLYEALKRSMHDREKLSHEKLGIHLSQDFTESERTESDTSSSIGTDPQEELAEIANDNEEGTESVQGGSSRRAPSYRLSSHNETYGQCLANHAEAPLTASDLESEPESEYQSESSNFEENPYPSPMSESPGPSQKEEERHQASETFREATVPENRPTPLMGLFGAAPAARGRSAVRGPRAQPRSRGVQRRGAAPKCFGCEARANGGNGERLSNGEVVSGAMW